MPTVTDGAHLERVQRIVEDLHLYMLLAMNPDGFESKSRTNANRIDLNRDYPDAFSPLGVNALNIEKRQPETAALMRWTLKTPFVASANFHEGALVANYPWDGSASRRTEYATCPDDSAFRHLALTYSRHHQFMAKSRKFQQGITNGAEWYPVYGGMQVCR
jgi:carboxypeptidase D